MVATARELSNSADELGQETRDAVSRREVKDPQFVLDVAGIHREQIVVVKDGSCRENSLRILWHNVSKAADTARQLRHMVHDACLRRIELKRHNAIVWCILIRKHVKACVVVRDVVEHECKVARDGDPCHPRRHAISQ